MLYKFKSKADGDVIMTSAVGDRIVEILGRPPGQPGTVTAAQAPDAVATLQAAADAEDAHWARVQDEARAAGEPVPPRPTPTLRHRIHPLLGLLRAAHAADEPVVWGV